MPNAASLIEWFALFILTASLIAAALSDAATYLIPNRYSAAIVLAFFLYAIGKPMAFTLEGLLVGIAMFVGGAIFFARGMIGGGDAKLASATALWFGWTDLYGYLLYASLFGGALTLLLLQFRQWPLPYALAGQPWLLKLHAKDSGIPYGIALAGAALLVYPDTPWMKIIGL